MVKREDVQAILETVAKASAIFDKALTPEERALLQRRQEEEDGLPPAYAADESSLAESEFELEAAADAMGTLADRIETVMERRHEAAYQEALRVYYTAEALARDPAHPELISHVEAMRRAHEESYGRPIPPKKEE